MNTFKLRLLSLFMLASLLAAFPTSSARAFGVVYRVTTRPPITKLCGSWARPCGLQQALKLAVPGDQIWIAAGTYKPTSGTDRTISFTLKDNVAVYGGFAGNETTLKQRDPRTNVTILSGDIGFRDDTSDNSYHVVVTSGASSSTVLDGVTITGGNADGAIPSDYDKGGGVLNLNGSPTLRNLIITENYSENYATNPVITFSGSGAGLYSTGNPTVERVVFSRNQTGETGTGGGMQSLGQPLIKDVTFKDNWAGAGGGLASMDAATLTNVTFSGNGAYNGGGMLNESFTYGTAVLTNVTFNNNVVCNNGAALYSIGDVTLTNVTIRGNYALKHRGGGIFLNWGTLTVRNTILWENTALIEGPQVYVDTSNSTADIRYSVVQGGCPAGSNCSNLITSDPKLATLGDNSGFTQTMPLLPGSSAIDAGDSLSCSQTDQRGVPRSQGGHCDIGAYEVFEPVGAGIYDDSHPAWVYDGAWTLSSVMGAYNNTLHETNSYSHAYVTFSGVQIVLTYRAGPDHGSFDVFIDGNKVDTVDASSPSLVQATWASPVLMAGTHTVVFEVYGGGDMDAIEVVGSSGVGPGTYDDTDAAWVYFGNWTLWAYSGLYNNTSHYTGTVGNYAELSFNGTGFTLSHTKDPGYGLIDVYVDNVFVTTINASSASTLLQQTYTSPTYAAGVHTVRFVHAGGGTYIDIDAITITP